MKAGANFARRRIVTAGVLSLAIAHGLTCGRARTAPAAFSGEQAYRRAGELVKLARHYEAPDRQRAVTFISDAIKPHAASVTLQRFEVTERQSGKRYPLVNIVARQNPSQKTRVLIGSHWDSRLWAEEDPDLARRDRPIPGANDSGSGVAVLLELARHTQALRGVGVDYVFFDGEEMGRPGFNSGYCQGSEYFAKNLTAVYPGEKPRAVLVLDMVGDRALDIYQEVSSLQAAPALVDEVWKQATALKAPGWHAAARHNIIDDHTPFQRLGIPAILIIDYDYPHWHRHSDTLDKLSAESLGSAGAVLLRFLSHPRPDWNFQSARTP